MFILVSYDLKNAQSERYKILNDLIDKYFRQSNTGEKLKYPVYGQGDVVKQRSQHIYILNQDIDEKERRKFMYTLVSKVMNELNPEDKLIVAPIYEDFCFKVEDFKIENMYKKTL